MATVQNPSGHPSHVARSASTTTWTGASYETKKVTGRAPGLCMFCRNPSNSDGSTYTTYISFQNPHEQVICTPCAESIRDALL